MKEHRTIQMSFRNTESEVKRIRNRMSLVGMKSPSAYLRKMAMDGYIVVIDLRDVREAIRLLRIDANNLNQYAKKANETGSIYLKDIKHLQKSHSEIWQVMRDILDRLSSIK